MNSLNFFKKLKNIILIFLKNQQIDDTDFILIRSN